MTLTMRKVKKVFTSFDISLLIFPFHRLFPEPAIFGGLFICLWLRQAISYKVKKTLPKERLRDG